MYSNFNEESQRVLKHATKEMLELNHPYVGSEHLLLALLQEDSIKEILDNKKINYEIFKKELIKLIGKGTKKSKYILYTPLLKKIIEISTLSAKDEKKKVSPKHLFLSLLEEGDGLAIRILSTMDVDINDLYQNYYKKNNSTPIIKTAILEENGYDMCKAARKKELDPILGREKEIERLIEILGRKTKNNPILLGEAGVGKTAIVEALAQQIEEKKVPHFLQNYRIISISLSSMIAGTKYRGEFEERVNNILKEVEVAKNVILFIDEIHNLVGAGGAEGAIDAANILKPALSRGKIRIIGATTNIEYKKSFSNDKALMRRFQTIEIRETDKKETLNILYNLKPIYENFHNILIKEDIIEKIYEYSNRYILNRQQPDKALDVLDEVCVKASLKNNKYKVEKKLIQKYNELIEQKKKYIIAGDFKNANYIKSEEQKLENKIHKLKQNEDLLPEVTTKDLIEVIESITNTKLYSKEQPLVLNDLEQKIEKEYIGNNDSIKELLKVIKSHKEHDLSQPLVISLKGPIGSGKTYLIETISNILNNRSPLFLDMLEYTTEESVKQLIGIPEGYVGFRNNNSFIDRLKKERGTFIVVKNYSYAHPLIKKILEKALEEGIIEDVELNKVSLKDSILIFENITNDFKSIGFSKTTDYINNKEDEKLVSKTIVLKPLEYKEIEKIIKVRLKEKYNIKTTSSKIKEIINELNYKEFGLRYLTKGLLNYIYNQTEYKEYSKSSSKKVKKQSNKILIQN